MANPQKENGYTPIANEIMEALARTRIPGEARQVLDVIIRKTYGFNKPDDLISLSQFVKSTGLKRPNVVRAIQKLLQMNIIRREYKRYQKRYPGIKSDTGVSETIPPTGGSYELNKDHEKWHPSIKSDTPVSKAIMTPVSKAIHTKDTITKDNINTSSLFEKSDSEKPKSAAKKNGWAIWVDINRERNRVDPIPAGPDTKAAKFLTDNIDGIQAVKDVMRLFLDDGDPFLQRNGHALRHITGRVNAYLNLADQMFGGGDADDISDILAIEEQIAKREAEERERKQNGNIKGHTNHC